MPKISIIVPVYNVERYLDNCIESILNQTFKDFELILVNDGSNDKSYEICKSYLEVDSRIKIINKENGGISSARNAGLDIAIGEYIGFVDSDDYIHPQMYEILYKNIKNEEADISLCNFKKVASYEECRLKIFLERDLNVKTLEYSNVDSSKELFTDKSITFVVAWNKLYNRRLFEKNRYKVGKIHEDEFIIHRLLYESNKVVYTTMELYFYLKRENSITSKSLNLKRLNLLEAYIDRINFFSNCKEYSLEEKALFMYSEEFLIHYYLIKNNLHNCKKILKGMKHQYIHLFPKILKLKYYTKKEKIVLIAFCLNSNIYKFYINYKKKYI